MKNESAKSITQPIIALDIAKILGIALILFTHYNQVLHFFESLLNQKSTRHLFFFWERLSFIVGNIGIALFIVASGVGLAYSISKKGVPASPQAWKRWYIQKANRLFPLYWLSVLMFSLGLVLLHALGKSLDHTVSIGEFLLTLTGLQAYLGYIESNINPAFWFFSLLIPLYLLFPFILFIAQRHRVVLLVMTFIASMLTGVALYDVSFAWYKLVVTSHVFGFSAGVMIAYLVHSRAFFEKPYVFRLLLGALFGVGSYTLVALLHSTQQLAVTVAANTLIGVVLFMSILFLTHGIRYPRIVTRCTSFLARISFPLFLFHLPFIALYPLVEDQLSKTQFVLVSLPTVLMLSIVADTAVNTTMSVIEKQLKKRNASSVATK